MPRVPQVTEVDNRPACPECGEKPPGRFLCAPNKFSLSYYRCYACRYWWPCWDTKIAPTWVMHEADFAPQRLRPRVVGNGQHWIRAASPKQPVFIEVPAAHAAEYADVKIKNYSHTKIKVPRGFGVTYRAILRERGTPTVAEVVDALGLICYQVLPCVVQNEWSSFKRLEAFVWAVTEHLRASDNAVRRHPIPAWAKSLREYRAAVTNGGEIFDVHTIHVPSAFMPRPDQVRCHICQGVHC